MRQKHKKERFVNISNKNMIDRLKQYSYTLPEELIASSPLSRRDDSRLLLVDTRKGKLHEYLFKDVPQLLSTPALVVLNDTKVVPARVTLLKDTGGRVELLFLINEFDLEDRAIRVLSNKKLTVGAQLFLDGKEVFTISGQEDHMFLLVPLFPKEEIVSFLMRYGQTPIPPYIGKTGLEEVALRERYQSVFAEVPASVAAPTASLHFTPALLQKLEEKGIEKAKVTLHVGQGTFASLHEEHFTNKKLHEEYFNVTDSAARAIHNAKTSGVPIVAVGTTALRTLETIGDKLLVGGKGEEGKTSIFIYPPYEFKVVDALITNFHLPQTSLMCLVDAFLQYKKCPLSILDVYEYAIRHKFRFYSFGDAMLIL